MKTRYYIAALLLVEVLLFATNYTPGTFLVGWDNIMPEFNFKLNFWRALTSLWQEYRGLGLLDGMAHSANLFHTIEIFLISLVVPQSVLRYVFIHLTHVIGGIAFFFSADTLTKRKSASFLGALLYMLNLGIIQMYYAPLEVFAVHFAALPLLAFGITKTLQNFTKKNLFFLTVVSLFTTPQAFVPTVFVIYSILFLAIISFECLYKKSFKKLAIVTLLLLCTNAFWLFPYVYSATYTPKVIASTRINQFASEEIFYRNKARGDLVSVFSFKGFMIDAIEYDTQTQHQVYFMDTWRNHTSTLFFLFCSLIIIGIAGFGVFKTVKEKDKKLFPYLFSFCVALFFLANNTTILETLNTLLRNTFPLLGEAFRFPFTKFITLFVFCFSLFFSYGLGLFLEKKEKYISFVFALFFLCIFYLSYPAFRGYFTSPMLRLSIPHEYFQTFDYLKTIDINTRIALFPVQSFWNWQYRDWGHRGSGFLWYGIEQPMLDRAFDPWSNYNEQFYNEISYAMQNQNPTLAKNTLQKYDIGLILLDEHSINGNAKQPINYDRIKRFLEENHLVTTGKTFGKITIYKTTAHNSWASSLHSGQTKKVATDFFSDNEDTIFKNEGNYAANKNNPSLVYPFPSLSTEKLQEDMPFSVQNRSSEIIFTTNAGLPKTDKTIISIPSLFANEFLIPVEISLENDFLLLTPIYPKISIDAKPIIIRPRAFVIQPTIVKNPTTITFVDTNHTIYAPVSEKKTYLLNKFPNTVKLSDGKNEEIIVVDTQTAETSPLEIPWSETISTLSIGIEKFTSPFTVENSIDNKLYTIKNANNSQHALGVSYTSAGQNPKDNSVSLEARNNESELTFFKENLFHQASYVVFAKTKYQSGLPVNLYIDNPLEDRLELETRLSKTKEENTIILPPSQNYFQGYGFHFIVKSVGNELAQSTIKDISLYPIPLETIKNIKIKPFEKGNVSTPSFEKTPLTFEKLAPFLYKVPAPATNDYLVLSQSFDPGWKAYEINLKAQNSNLETFLAITFPFFFGTEIKNHALINNWENGWALHNQTAEESGRKTIILIFLPQYLEYIGLLLLTSTFLWFICTISLQKFDKRKTSLIEYFYQTKLLTYISARAAH